MPRKDNALNTVEKERQRSEIDDQIAEYLRKGGKIDVVGQGQAGSGSDIGSVWHDQDQDLRDTRFVNHTA